MILSVAPWQSLLREVRGPPPSQKRSRRSTARPIEGIAGVTPSPLFRRHGTRDLDAVLGFDRVIARQWHGVLAARDLDLKNHLVHVPEGHFAASQIELPHAAETVVVAC